MYVNASALNMLCSGPMFNFTHGHAAGESVVVARGGKGGMGVTRPTREDNARLQTRKRRFLVSLSASSRL